MSKNENERNFNKVLSHHGNDTCPGSSAILSDDVQAFLENLQIGVYVIQKRGLFSYVNKRLSHLLGYETPEELIGKSIWTVIHPEDRKLVKLKIRQQETQLDFDQHIIRVFKKDATIIWVYMGGWTALYQGSPANIGQMLDMTPIKKAEKYLKNHMTTSKTIIEEIEDGVSEVDLKGNTTFSNLANGRIWGYTLSDIEGIGVNYRSHVDEETAKFLFKTYNEIYRTGIPRTNVVYDIIRKDGTRRSVEGHVSLIRNEEGRITGFRNVNRDITERRKAEKELAEHRTRLEAIFRSVKEVIITLDPELKVILANDEIEYICGVAAKEVTGTLYPPSFNECSKSCREIVKQTLEKGLTITDCQIECGRAQRHHQLVSLTSSPLKDAAGKFTGALLVIRDMTLIRGLERELRERHQFQNMIGKSKSMQDIYRLLDDLADLETTVLITGESGTGKELVAKAIHFSGQRSFNPFIAVNCSALTENLLESELFGHVKGAFTGAIHDKQGRFQAADRGTILLDEIGDISPLIQLKLLRVLQEKVIERVGESIPQKVDVRVIACTNKDLKEKIRKGEFREDLYYRLKIVEITIPPLRDRLEDLPLLIEHFRIALNERFKKEIDGFSNEVLNKLMSYAWPGNIRELEHVIEHAFVLCHGRVIMLEHLPVEIRLNEKTEKDMTHHILTKRKADDQAIQDALIKTGGNKSKAARLLGINRMTIYRRTN